MTDNEIVKSLESLLDRMRAYESLQASIGKGLVEDIISMYNRQKAEIERLQCSEKRNGRQIGSLIYHLEQAKSKAYREFAEKVKPILKEMFDLMIDDDEGKCIVENCKKHSSFPCMNEYCIKENWTEWEAKVDNTLKELTEK